jgi:glycosyltransferase involved in cell wall biosynthesis
MTQDNIGVAHWAADCDGGGERVAWELARTFDSPVHLGSRNRHIEPEDVECRDVFGSSAVTLVQQTRLRFVADLLAWERADRLRQFDTLITSGNPTLRYVPEDDQTWICYLHHTRRAETDRFGEVGGGTVGVARQLKMMAERVLHSSAASRPDLIVCNSEVVARRARRYWGVDADRIRVVHPPVDVGKLSPTVAETQDHYLALGRLAPSKRVAELAARWSEHAGDRQLLVAGDGPERDRVNAAAGSNVSVLGRVSEERKRELLSSARALIMPADAEDFGIVPIEALASGTPVVGVREGMTQHQIRDGVTGHTFEWQSVSSLIEAVSRLKRDGVEWSATEIAEWATRFGRERFREEMRAVVAEADKRATVEPELFDDTPEPADTVEPIAATDGGVDDE